MGHQYLPPRPTLIKQCAGVSLILTQREPALALEAYREIPIKFIDVLLEQTLEICNKLNIYAYDAYLIQCALKTNTSLLTLDNRLLAAAEKLGVKALEI